MRTLSCASFAEDAGKFEELSRDWYKAPVAWASREGIALGVDDTDFAPDSEVTREQLAVIYYRYTVNMGYNSSAVGDINVFPDISGGLRPGTKRSKPGNRCRTCLRLSLRRQALSRPAK